MSKMANEKRLIDANALLQHKRKMSGADFGGEFWDEAVLVSDIDNAPTVDAVEVVHGRKAESAISSTGLMCTACHSDVDRDAVFCKYCGAKMDGEEKDSNLLFADMEEIIDA